MALSVFDLFKIGIGPSSSHTVGPMWAALHFVRLLEARGLLGQVRRVRADLYGSLALTGRGHASDKAILLGLSGEQPDAVDPDAVAPLLGEVRSQHTLRLAGRFAVPFDEAGDLVFHNDESLPHHPNGLRLTAFGSAGQELVGETYYSVGGGFVVSADEAEAGRVGGSEPARPVPHDFRSAAELLEIGRRTGLSMADIVRQNEAAWRAARRDRRRIGPHLGRHGAVHRAAAVGARALCRAAYRCPGGPGVCSATSKHALKRRTRWRRSTG